MYTGIILDLNRCGLQCPLILQVVVNLCESSLIVQGHPERTSMNKVNQDRPQPLRSGAKLSSADRVPVL